MSHLDSGIIHELLDGEIPSSQLGPIQAHLAACAECRAKLAEERQLADGVDDLIGMIEVPEATAEAAAPRVAPPRRVRWLRDVAWAATLVIAAGLGYAVRGPAALRVQHDTVIVATGIDSSTFQPSPASNLAQPAVPVRPPIAAKTEPRAGDVAVSQPPPIAAAEAVRPAAPPQTVANNATPQRTDSATSPVVRSASGGAPVIGTTAAGAARDVISTKQTIALAPPAPAKDSETRVDSARTSLAAARSIIGGGGGGRGGGGRGGRGGAVRIDSISLADAMQRLGGTIRLIDGLLPLRYELQSPFVRVVYPGGIVLRQQLVDGAIQFVLTGPPSLPADSLDKLRAQVHE